jgi:hypothetical protein
MNSTFEEFRNNVFCRRDSNQHKARQLWKEINSIIDFKDRTLFQIEWSHFIMGELDADGFSLYFDKYVKKYYS